MKNFLCEGFLLSISKLGVACTTNTQPPACLRLSLPLNPAEVAQDRQFDNMSKIWLEGDHYKWRGMRSAGSTAPDHRRRKRLSTSSWPG
ncbi:glucuronate isomerase [Vibrio lentus]|nr:glucuronate isomerase [Vibrio lentus]